LARSNRGNYVRYIDVVVRDSLLVGPADCPDNKSVNHGHRGNIDEPERQQDIYVNRPWNNLSGHILLKNNNKQTKKTQSLLASLIYDIYDIDFRNVAQSG